MNKLTAVSSACLLVAVMTYSALAWHGPGHDKATRCAVEALPATLPEFFRAGAETIANTAVDPDLFCRPVAPPELSDTERPEHYLDMEMLDGFPDKKLPSTRYEFLEQVYAKKLKPAQVGLLPWAITEWTQRLTVAFAEHRKWPEDGAIRAKCLVYAGLLAHYAEDAAQPLHTTVHHDGRAKAPFEEGSSPKTGIHAKVDALIGKLKAANKDIAAEVARDAAPTVFEDVFTAAMDELKRSHALVDRVYELEKDLPGVDEPFSAKGAGADVEKFARDRLSAAVRFTSSLYLTAWRDSEKIKFPDWHQRPPAPQDVKSVSSPAGP
ncbi:MAG: hypothetical protein ACE15C_04795 [Phycisphaerae bacterium]